jgi:hypothetical protein
MPSLSNSCTATEMVFYTRSMPRCYKQDQLGVAVIPHGGASNKFTVALRVVRRYEKKSNCLGLKLGHPVRAGYKYGGVALHVGGVPNLRE